MCPEPYKPNSPVSRASRGWVGAGHAVIGNMLGPLGPGPVALVVSGEGFDQPAWRDPGERRVPTALG